MATDMIFVMANPKKKRQETPQGVFSPLSPGQVALIEEHPDHPFSGVAGVNRVFIVQGNPPCEAALTEAVQEKLLQGQLVQLSRADALARYKQMTGSDYPGLVVESEDSDEDSKKMTASDKRKATIAAKKAAAEQQTSESDEDDEDSEED